MHDEIQYQIFVDIRLISNLNVGNPYIVAFKMLALWTECSADDTVPMMTEKKAHFDSQHHKKVFYLASVYLELKEVISFVGLCTTWFPLCMIHIFFKLWM